MWCCPWGPSVPELSEPGSPGLGTCSPGQPGGSEMEVEVGRGPETGRCATVASSWWQAWERMRGLSYRRRSQGDPRPCQGPLVLIRMDTAALGQGHLQVGSVIASELAEVTHRPPAGPAQPGCWDFAPALQLAPLRSSPLTLDGRTEIPAWASLVWERWAHQLPGGKRAAPGPRGPCACPTQGSHSHPARLPLARGLGFPAFPPRCSPHFLSVTEAMPSLE